MTIAEFIEVSSDLEKYFGKELNEFEAKMWFEGLKNLSKERFRQLVRECIMNDNFMPKLAKIVEYNKKLPEVKKEETEVIDCKECNNTGVKLYDKLDSRNEKNYLYVAKCICGNGKKLGKSIPSITEINIMTEVENV